jgi:hypothetical protein
VGPPRRGGLAAFCLNFEASANGEQIRVLEWRQVSFLILLILIAVAAIDFVSGRLRAAMAGRKSPPGWTTHSRRDR